MNGRNRGTTAIVVWCVTLGIGLLVIGGTFTPILNPPQCPSYATRMPDGSRCEIGFNFGLAVYWIIGLILVASGAIGLLIHLTLVRGAED